MARCSPSVSAICWARVPVRPARSCPWRGRGVSDEQVPRPPSSLVDPNEPLEDQVSALRDLGRSAAWMPVDGDSPFSSMIRAARAEAGRSEIFGVLAGMTPTELRAWLGDLFSSVVRAAPAEAGRSAILDVLAGMTPTELRAWLGDPPEGSDQEQRLPEVFPVEHPVFPPLLGTPGEWDHHLSDGFFEIAAELLRIQLHVVTADEQ